MIEETRHLDEDNRVVITSLEVGSQGDAITFVINTVRGELHMAMPIDKAEQLIQLLHNSIETAKKADI